MAEVCCGSLICWRILTPALCVIGLIVIGVSVGIGGCSRSGQCQLIEENGKINLKATSFVGGCSKGGWNPYQCGLTYGLNGGSTSDFARRGTRFRGSTRRKVDLSQFQRGVAAGVSKHHPNLADSPRRISSRSRSAMETACKTSACKLGGMPSELFAILLLVGIVMVILCSVFICAAVPCCCFLKAEDHHHHDMHQGSAVVTVMGDSKPPPPPPPPPQDEPADISKI